jgi:hypothetical protein
MTTIFELFQHVRTCLTLITMLTAGYYHLPILFPNIDTMSKSDVEVEQDRMMRIWKNVENTWKTRTAERRNRTKFYQPFIHKRRNVCKKLVYKQVRYRLRNRLVYRNDDDDKN